MIVEIVGDTKHGSEPAAAALWAGTRAMVVWTPLDGFTASIKQSLEETRGVKFAQLMVLEGAERPDGAPPFVPFFWPEGDLILVEN